jgi:ABC-2 type transport system ATP-binding protein
VAPSQPVIEVKGVRKVFTVRAGLKKRRHEALKGVSISVYREVFGFIGPNGAGKTTLIKIIMGFIRQTAGTVSVLGKGVGAVKHRLGFLPENPHIYPSIKGIDYLSFCCDAYRIPYYERRRRIARLLELVDLLGAEEKKVGSYSKGMVQRLLFAGTLVNDPDVLVLDEPMSGLDPIGRKIIADVMEEQRQKGKTVFYSSHIIQDVERLSDTVAIVIDGEVKLVGDVAQLLAGTALSGYLVTARKHRLERKKVERHKLWQELDALKREGYEVICVEPLRASLEDIFVSLVKGESLEPGGKANA